MLTISAGGTGKVAWLTISFEDGGVPSDVIELPNGVIAALLELATSAVLGESAADVARYLIIRGLDDMARARKGEG